MTYEIREPAQALPGVYIVTERSHGFGSETLVQVNRETVSFETLEVWGSAGMVVNERRERGRGASVPLAALREILGRHEAP